MGHNGISAYVAPIDDLESAPAGDISCALGGNGVLTTFIQEAEFYCGRDVAILRPKVALTKQQVLFYCLCIKSNRFRYNYGRQANKTLPTLPVPTVDEIPLWVNAVDLNQIMGADAGVSCTPTPPIAPDSWKPFRYDALFDIKKGQRLTKSAMEEGETPFIGAIDSGNGYRQYVSAAPNHEAGTITVSYNGSVGEAFYQSAPFWASDDINVLYPKFDMNVYVAMFICALIRREKFRFSYGRKWHLGRMKESIIRLPVDAAGEPDLAFMEGYVKSLPYSKSI
ncbi:restriction endonuclease subunit S [Sphingomonas sp.]|uniref:restriction endonuclease subunit S n=1 Tax=Sphingomonas sp. TaxID=28214 RepID=UPI0017E6F5E2|nr:restriction endonuclease subunit S [Sphingomonas sp.]MBA3510360.1 restriction endonuclease subunit S [Sphingomonas sp.]